MITDFVEYCAFSLIYTVCTYLPLAFFISGRSFIRLLSLLLFSEEYVCLPFHLLLILD